MDGDTPIVTEDGSVKPIRDYISGSKILSLNNDYRLGMETPLAFLDMGIKIALKLQQEQVEKLQQPPSTRFLELRGGCKPED